MTSTEGATRGQSRPSLGKLVATLSEKLSNLVRAEIELARAELAEKARNAALGIGLLVGAAVLAYFGLAVLIAAAVLGLAEALPAWLAALIVAVLLLGMTALLAVLGKNALDRSKPPMPERAQANLKADVAAVKEGLTHRGGQG